MAILNNAFFRGMSGMIGDTLVFRQVNGRTIVSNAPAKSGSAASEKQQETRDRFREASAYAKNVTALPNMKRAYAEGMNGKFLSAHAVAVADFPVAPKLHAINTDLYTGKIGSDIIIEATDDFCVVLVSVMIVDASGVLIEKGNAVNNVLTRREWVYKTTMLNSNLKGTIIKVDVRDLPGNSAKGEAVV